MVNILQVNDLCYSHKDAEKNLVFNNLSFNLKGNEIVSILGKNGCGKTTLFNLISGFLKPDKGTIIVNGYQNLVFQEYSLLDWANVYENVELALLKDNLNKDTMKGKVDKTLKLFSIGHLKDRLPKQLSGGQKQRVAIARAFVSESRILLLDEPFSALDYYTKEQLQEDLLKIIRKEKKSAILVTHSIDEAIFFSDRILLINKKGIYEDIKIDFPRIRKSNIKLTNKFLNIKKKILNLLN